MAVAEADVCIIEDLDQYALGPVDCIIPEDIDAKLLCPPRGGFFNGISKTYLSHAKHNSPSLIQFVTARETHPTQTRSLVLIYSSRVNPAVS